MRKPLPRRDALAALGVGAAAMALNAGAAPPRRPNVLLITSEDNGPELGCYGDPYARTPHLDRLAAEGTRFQNAYITSPVCSPSRGTIFTGLYPHQNGQIGLATHKYAMFEKWPNVVSLLGKAGYRTGILGKIHVNPESAFRCDFRALPSANFNMRDVRKYAAAAEKHIGASDEPFFLMVNFPDAHFPLLRQYAGLPKKPLEATDVKTLPFVGADSERMRKFAANYYNCLSRLDSGIGLLLDVLKRTGKTDDTLIVYLGDHGAQFSRGKATVFEGGTRVPFMVRWPAGLKAGVVRDELISSIDILPTILDATGLDAPKNLPGRSVLPLCRGEKVAWRQYLFTEQDGSAPFWTFPQRAVRDGRYKLIVTLLDDRPDPIYPYYATQRLAFFSAGASEAEIAAAPEAVRKGYAAWKATRPIELYDLQDDPHEWTNLAGKPEVAATQKRLLEALRDWQKRTADPLADPAKLAKFVEETDGVVKRKTNYRRSKTFRWKYLEYFR